MKRTIFYLGDAHQTGYEIIDGMHTQQIDVNAPIPPGWSESRTPPEKDVTEMDKQELDAHARTLGIDLDRRKSLRNMLADLERARK